MKRIAYPYPAASRRMQVMCATLLVLELILSGGPAKASRQPNYGGTLRVQMRERISTIDPRQWPSDSRRADALERLGSLVFDRLVRFDKHGVVQPALAVSWQHDAQSKRWQFLMRTDVKFSDGAPLTPGVAALALQQLLGNAFDVRATFDSVVIQTDHSQPDFPMLIALGRYFIFRVADDGSLAGTGPFRVAAWDVAEGSAKAVFVANESCWAGRPFVDKIELTMGVNFEQQANAIAFGQADVVELPASQVRRASQRGVRTVSSDPVELFALQFDTARPAVRDMRVRQAISLALDRSSISDVILQRQGVVAGGLLPNWLSGYEFLFPAAEDLPRAKELLTATGREVSHPAPLVLIYDSGDADARAVAERVAVNLREAGMVTHISEQSAVMKTSSADMRLVRHRIWSPDPGVALTELLNVLGESPAGLDTPEQAYAAERAPIDAFRVIPLVHLSESYGLGPQVRDWMPPRWGGWRLDDLWLESASAGGTSP